MKRIVRLIVSLGVPALCSVADPVPWSGYCVLLDQVASAASSRPEVGPVALDLLEQVAMDRSAEVSAQAQERVGLRADQLQDRGFRAPEVRACAIRRIGGMGLAEGVVFLKNLRPDDFAHDTTQQVWPASRIALADATVRAIQDPQQQIEFLERALTDRSVPVDWVVDQLCDRGSLGSLVPIQQAIRSRRNGQRDEDDIVFCESRIYTLYGKPNRAKALGAVLNVQTSADNPRLTGWAIQQLFEIHSPAAKAELDRFLNEIDGLPDGSPTKQRVLQFRPMITPAPPLPRK